MGSPEVKQSEVRGQEVRKLKGKKEEIFYYIAVKKMWNK